MKLANIFTDHMVIQAMQPVKIFGEGEGKAKVSFLSHEGEAVSKGGKWCVTLPAVPYGGPYEMTINLNGENIVLRDIYVGEVWIACGQSNMEMPLFRTDYGIDEAKYSKNDNIRFFTVPRRTVKDIPLHGWHFEKVEGKDTPWQLCCEESALHFSAIGYYVAKELYEKLGVAIGIISCNWGGKPIESFISREYFKNTLALKKAIDEYEIMMSQTDMESYMKEYMVMADERKAYNERIDYDEVEEVEQKGLRATAGVPYPIPPIPHGPYVADMPGCLYDSMVSRIIPYGVKGMLWYQGESNKPEGYLEKYLVFMDCMRDSFENPEMPFYAVELASYTRGIEMKDDRFVSGSNWAFTREQQQKATEIGKNNYLVTTMELGDLYDIHPMNKKDLSHRLALKVLKHSYGADIYADQPVFEKAEFDGNKAYITLKNSEGLYCKNFCNFKIYAADESCELKRADVQIDENSRLVLSCPQIEKIHLVRYGFDNYYAGIHIYNKAGLPLAPFRTDDYI